MATPRGSVFYGPLKIKKLDGTVITVVDANGNIVGAEAATLTSAHLFVGNASNVATDTAITGDVTISNAGVTTIGAGAVTVSKLSNTVMAQAVVSLTAAQTKALNTTPQTLVAAPGAGKLIVVDSIIVKNVFGTVAYTGANALQFFLGDTSGQKAVGDIANTFINIASGTHYAVSIALAAYADTAGTAMINAPLIVSVPTANPGAGDGILTFTVNYFIVTP